MPAAYLKAPHLAVVQFCTKIPYENRDVAKRIIKSFSSKAREVQSSQGIMNCYRCPICSGWHVGHR